MLSFLGGLKGPFRWGSLLYRRWRGNCKWLTDGYASGNHSKGRSVKTTQVVRWVGETSSHCSILFSTLQTSFYYLHSNILRKMFSTPCLCLLPPIPETAIIPYHPADRFDILAAVLENSLLTMNLRPHHFNTLSKSCDLYALDYNLANGIWGTLKDIAQTIHLTADSTCDPHQWLPVYINPYRLQEISMAAPQILYIEAFTQNLLLAATTRW